MQNHASKIISLSPAAPSTALGADAFQDFNAKLQPDPTHPLNIIQINATQSHLIYRQTGHAQKVPARSPEGGSKKMAIIGLVGCFFFFQRWICLDQLCSVQVLEELCQAGLCCGVEHSRTLAPSKTRHPNLGLLPGSVQNPTPQFRAVPQLRLKPDAPIRGRPPAPSNTRRHDLEPCKATGKHLPFAAIFDACHPILAAHMALCNTLAPANYPARLRLQILVAQARKNHAVQLKCSFSSTQRPKGSIQHKQEPEPSTQPRAADPARASPDRDIHPLLGFIDFYCTAELPPVLFQPLPPYLHPLHGGLII